jgi:glycosyltransferase involved in cell wall biosynthesis
VSRGKRNVRIAVVAVGSPLSRNAWSGIPFYIYRELTRRYSDVHAVEIPLFDQFDRALSKIMRLSQLRWFVPRTPILTQLAAKLVGASLERLKPDLVVCINAAHKTAMLKRPWPMVLVEDATFDTIVSYYGRFGGLGPNSRAVGHAVERNMIDRCRAVLLASTWARDDACRRYQGPAERFTVAPMGANLDDDPGPLSPHDTSGELKLLFVGYEWGRKGGPLALKAFVELRKRLANVSLHVVGCSPAEAESVEGVVLHGRLHKSVPEEFRRLQDLYRSSSFFFMPTRQEAYGIVYCEACAFGLPVVATDTGGVGEIVRNGENGMILPLAASAVDYADCIERIWTDPSVHRSMQYKARQAYIERLSWQSWGEIFDMAVWPSEALRTRTG